MSFIEIQNISKSFPIQSKLIDYFKLSSINKKKVYALDKVSLNIEKEDIFGIIGPNGAGKTTLIKILSTLIPPDSGTIKIKGYDIEHNSIEIRKCVGLVTGDERSFYFRLSGRENLLFYALLHNISLEEANKRINELLAFLELNDEADLRFQTYSSGMKQRLALARALIHNPDILLFDEPTKSLDPISSHKLKEFICKELSQNLRKTIIITSHNLNEIEELCNKIAILVNGKILSSGYIKDVKQNLTGRDDVSLQEAFLKINIF